MGVIRAMAEQLLRLQFPQKPHFAFVHIEAGCVVVEAGNPTMTGDDSEEPPGLLFTITIPDEHVRDGMAWVDENTGIDPSKRYRANLLSTTDGGLVLAWSTLEPMEEWHGSAS